MIQPPFKPSAMWSLPACLLQVLVVKRITWLSGSGASILLGLFLGWIIAFATVDGSEANELMFKRELFFYVLLPPIIFEAGFSMRTTAFFRNMTTILLYSVLGTVISTVVIGMGLFGLARLNIVPLDSTSPVEALSFGALLSALDTVATMSLMNSTTRTCFLRFWIVPLSVKRLPFLSL